MTLWAGECVIKIVLRIRQLLMSHLRLVFILALIFYEIRLNSFFRVCGRCIVAL